MQFTKEDIITTDKYAITFPTSYYKTDVIFYNQPIVWRERIIQPPSQQLPILISGHSDYGITDEIVDYYQPKTWFCVNKQTNRSNVFALPLGIANYTMESEVHPISGNLDCMINVMQETCEYKNWIYMNFDINTFPTEREYVYNLFKDREYVTIGEMEITLDGRTRFLREIKNHIFVLCPRGNGLDTHRLWETLYMGSIPIVRKDIAFAEFIDLPICFIDNWNEITMEFLQKEKKRINSKTWNLDKLKIGYWINRIIDQIYHT